MTPQRPDDIRRISLKTLKIENKEKAKNTYFLNVLQPKDPLEKEEAITVKRIKGDDCFGVEITSKNTIETFLFSDTNKIVYNDIQSESKWISVVKDYKGEILKTTSYEM